MRTKEICAGHRARTTKNIENTRIVCSAPEEVSTGGPKYSMRPRLIIAALLIAMAAAAPARADVRLAYVDIQRALNECRAGKAAKTQFRGRIERLQAQLEGEQSDVERLKRELEQKGSLMQPDQRQNLEDD